MSARKIEVMSQDEIALSMYEIETEIEVTEGAIEVDHIETAPLAKVISLTDYRKALGYSK